MSLKNIKLGIDIDNTLLPEAKAFVTFVQQNIDSTFQYTDWNTWDILSFVSEDKKNLVIEYLKVFFTTSNIISHKPMQYVPEFLQHFSPDNLYYITARSTWLFKEPRKETADWISHHNIPYIDKNVILESEYIVGKTTKKAQIATELTLDVFFEDNPYNAQKIAKTGCLVFLIDYPYNRTVSGENIIRIGKFNDKTGNWINNPWKQLLGLLNDGTFEQIIKKK